MATIEEFRFGEMLGVLFGREVEIDGQKYPLEPIVSHIIGMDVDRKSMPKMIPVCRRVLLSQFPKLEERKDELVLLMDASHMSFSDNGFRFIVPPFCKRTRLYRDLFLVQRVDVEFVYFFGERQTDSFASIFGRARGKENQHLN